MKYELTTFGLRRLNLPLEEVKQQARPEELVKIEQLQVGEVYDRKAGFGVDRFEVVRTE